MAGDGVDKVDILQAGVIEDHETAVAGIEGTGSEGNPRQIGTVKAAVIERALLIDTFCNVVFSKGNFIKNLVFSERRMHWDTIDERLSRQEG